MLSTRSPMVGSDRRPHAEVMNDPQEHSDPSLESPPGVSKAKVQIQSVLQILTVTMLGTGAWVGKGAYEDLAETLVQVRIEAAELAKSVESLDTKLGHHESRPHVGAEQELRRHRDQFNELERRLVLLESYHVNRRSGRKR